MDVRCEKCGTEYELDDRRLKPGGVTVKCTTCGHMFKVRKRSQTAVGVAVQPPSAPSATMDDVPTQRRQRISSGPQTPRRLDTAVGPMAANQAAREPRGSAATPLPQPSPNQTARGSAATPLPPPLPGRTGRSGATPEPFMGEGTSGPLSEGSEPANKERTWMIRLPSGEIETCRELATLQQWIVSGKVMRASEISRNGRTWKRLGDIQELASFFAIADEARAARRDRPPSAPQPSTRPASASGPQRPVRRSSAGSTQPPPLPAAAARPASQSGSLAPVRPASASGPLPAARTSAPRITSSALADMQNASEPIKARADTLRAPNALVASKETVAGEGLPTRPMQAVGPGPSSSSKAAAGAGSPAAAEPPLDGDSQDDTWGGAPREPRRRADPTGPLGGMSRSVPTYDVAFAGKIKPLKDTFGSSGVADDAGPDADEAEAVPQERRGIGRWIVAASLVLMAGAAAAVYLFVFRASGPEPMAAAGMDASVAAAEIDAAAVANAPIDAAAPVVEQPADNGAAEVLAVAEEAVLAGGRTSLEAAAGKLAALVIATGNQADENVALLAERARVAAALAQALFDEAAVVTSTDAKAAKEMQRQAEQQVLEARNLAKKALQLDGTHTGATIVMGEVLRLQGKRLREIDQYLQKVLKSDSQNREALLVRALALASDKQERKARQILSELEAGTKGKDLRPTYRLALMDFAAKSFDDARRRTEEVLAMNAEHTGAIALAGQIREALAVDTSDPMPPEEGSGEDSAGAESYDALLGKADSKRGSGKCGDAMPLYERALDENPTGVEALTGMGYCHLERRELASAYDKFKAALAVSSRYQEAMLGIARMYELQGRKEQAVEEYQRFLDAHPNSSRAAEVRRQIERLSGGSGDKPDGSGTGEGTPQGSDSGGTAKPSGGGEASEPKPTPEPAPAPEGSGSGSP